MLISGCSSALQSADVAPPAAPVAGALDAPLSFGEGDSVISLAKESPFAFSSGHGWKPSTRCSLKDSLGGDGGETLWGVRTGFSQR